MRIRNAPPSAAASYRRIAVNPPAARLGEGHAVLWGRRAGDYHVAEFSGPLSIKTMVSGSGAWTTGEGRFDLAPGTFLVVNQDQPYRLDIAPQSSVETFCLFFARGYADAARRSLVLTDEALLDQDGEAPGAGARDAFARDAVPAESAPMFANIARRDGGVLRALTDLRLGLRATGPADPAIDDRVAAIVSALLAAECDVRWRMARVPAARASTREEIMRRLLRAREAIEDGLAGPMPLEMAAAVACLSPFHFHRLFTRTFAETPGRYLRRRRLERARQRLATSDLPVAVIAHGCGFESLGSFGTLFRRAHGLPPAAWRRKQNRKGPCRNP